MKKARLDERRPLDRAGLARIREAVHLEWTFHTNALEGNTLTQRETQVVLEGMTIGHGKSLREHLEVINHKAALELLEDLVSRMETLTAFTTRQLQGLILRSIKDEDAGRFRTVQVSISGSDHLPPSPADVPAQMDALFAWYGTALTSIHPVRLAAQFHHRFVWIHPFVDGNGRTARLLMNLILMNAGYPPAILKADAARRAAYLDALEVADLHGNRDAIELIVAQAVDESLDKWLLWTRP